MLEMGMKATRTDPVAELIAQLTQIEDQAAGLVAFNGLPDRGADLLAVRIALRAQARDSRDSDADHGLAGPAGVTDDLGLQEWRHNLALVDRTTGFGCPALCFGKPTPTTSFLPLSAVYPGAFCASVKQIQMQVHRSGARRRFHAGKS
jgi:hypothetical protein